MSLRLTADRFPITEFGEQPTSGERTDVYFSADVETDGPIPGPFSMLSFALVYAGESDGERFTRPDRYNRVFYREIRPISQCFEQEALDVNRLDRQRLVEHGPAPELVMSEAAEWVRNIAQNRTPVVVAYPLSFDWIWLYWYFVMYSRSGSPFGHSSCFDLKTAYAISAKQPIAMSGRTRLPHRFVSSFQHTHHAVDDAVEQAEIFAKLMLER